MNEKKMRSKIVDRLDPIDAFAVENDVHDGCPDICTVMGWIELKIASWPKRADSPVKIILRQSQKIWLRRWCAHGGRAWVFTKLLDTWTLHNGVYAYKEFGKADREELLSRAVQTWTSIPSRDDLIEALRGTNWNAIASGNY